METPEGSNQAVPPVCQSPPPPRPRTPAPVLRSLGNAFTLWLGIDPPEIFFYAFLPPLLLDSALSIDFFLFRKAREGGLPHIEPANRLPAARVARLPRLGCLHVQPTPCQEHVYVTHHAPPPLPPPPHTHTTPTHPPTHPPTHHHRPPPQVMLQVFCFAFLVVLLSALLTTPLLLHGLGLAAHGWRWQHGALFR